MSGKQGYEEKCFWQCDGICELPEGDLYSLVENLFYQQGKISVAHILGHEFHKHWGINGANFGVYILEILGYERPKK